MPVGDAAHQALTPRISAVSCTHTPLVRVAQGNTSNVKGVEGATLMAAIMIVDGSAVGYANQYSHTLTAQGMEVQAISGTLWSLSVLLRTHYDFFPVLAWDGRAQWRYDLYADYKSECLKSEASRAARASFERQRPHIQTMAGKLGLMQLEAPNAETDDVAFQLANVLAAGGHDVLIVTNDSDLLQAVGHGIGWFDSRAKKLIATADDLHDHVGTPDPWTYLQAKALAGDASDTIEGLPRVGIPTALKVFGQHGGSIESFYAHVEAGKVDLKKKTLGAIASAAGRATYERNMKLMDLSRAPVLRASDVTVSCEPLDEVVFSDWVEHFSLQAILRNVGQFIEPFIEATRRPGQRDLEAAIARLGT